MANKRKTIAPEFKLQANKLAKINGNIEQTARNLGIASSALHRWIQAQNNTKPKVVPPSWVKANQP